MRLLKSFGNALRGIGELIKSEKNFQIHLLALTLVVALGFYFSIKADEWIDILLISGAVLMAEAFNSSIEKLMDHLHPERHEKVRVIKDIAAGAVLLLAITAIIIAVLIFLPYMK